jgi:hypothetical protein
MKLILIFLILLSCIIIYTSCQEYFEFRENYTEINFLARKLIGNATCMKDDIELTDSLFKCKMNNKYSPININITTIKYRNFAPFIRINQSPSPSFSLLRTLTPSLTPPPLFSDDDFRLIGTTIDPATKNISLNDYKKLMKITNYGNNMIFDKLTQTPTIESSSLEDVNNSLLYLPDCIVPYIKYLYDMKLLQSFIDINKIKTISNIAEQFQSYIKGLLIEYTKPETNNFKLDREIVIIYTSDMKNIVNIQFNQTISYYDSKNILQNNTISTNINTKYDYLIINSYVDAKLQNSISDFIDNIDNTIKIYGNALKSRQLIDDYDIDDLLEKINNIEKNNILYVNYLLNGIQLVKRVDGNLVFIDYFELKDFNYYKNMCPDPANNFFYKGRCYSNCPKNYSNLGLTCVLDNEKNTYEINKLFDPDSNFCKQLCLRSYDDISRYEQIMQQACWCESMSCNKCGEFSIGQCNC